MANNERQIVDGVEALEATIARVKAAQRVFATYTQDEILFSALVLICE